MVDQDDQLCCTTCDTAVPLTEFGVPLFVPIEQKNTVAVHTTPLSKVKKALRFLKPPHHSVYLNNLGNTHYEGSELQTLINALPEGAVVINIGSLSRRLELRKDITIYNVDISLYKDVDLVADGHHLPIKNNSVDLILLKNVLEHVKQPGQFVEEAHRILKPKGLLYVKNPFMQPFHAVPDDYYRWSQNGNKEFFKQFKERDFGVSIGPSSALSWILREYLAMLCSFGSYKAYTLLLIPFGWLTFWIKYLDVFFRSNPMSHRLASAFYMLYERRDHEDSQN